MTAIAVHHTGTTDAAWDGPANEARLKTDGSEVYYKSAFAWQNPDGDPETKTAYKFIHHEVDGEGNVGEANTRACVTGIAVLNGARGGANIPEGDRAGVHAHLAAHLKDAGIEAPDLRSAPDRIEHRSYQMHEMRIEEDAGKPKMIGYAAVFDELSPDLWGFREKIRRGAFTKTLSEADVRALWNHDTNFVLGRSKSGTLKLWEDQHGLGVEIVPPDTTWARDLLTTMKRGDVDQMSFSFEAIREQWSTEDDQPVREVVEAKLYDVSPVTFPAYPQTNVAVRAALGIAADKLMGTLHRLEAGAATGEDMQVLSSLLVSVQSRLDAAPAEGGHPAESSVKARTALLKRKLELARAKSK